MARRKSTALKVHKDEELARASLDSKLYEGAIPEAPSYTLSEEKSDPDDMHPPKKKMRRHEKTGPIAPPVGAEERYSGGFSAAAAVRPRTRAHATISSATAVCSRKRNQTDAAVTASEGPERKRVALKEKNPNPSSSDIHSVDLHRSFPHKSKLKQNVETSILKDDVAVPQSGGPLLRVSPLSVFGALPVRWADLSPY